MQNLWQDFLNIIDLDKADRQNAQLDILKEFPSGYPQERLLLSLLDEIEQLFQSREFTMLWFNNGRRIYFKHVSKEDMKFIYHAWGKLAGNYILFLPKDASIRRQRVEDEEAFIGQCLKAHNQLVVKTEDAYVVLHLTLTEKVY
ncbi:hypothetical protein [Planococcus lenghuensis]|uniref:Uncharacterized protein n=1 Tax=Planococcus lenghuensis TaxID=2213202 RepID=A0A1Q2L0U9_9BACL|nr:hypothetical protein [Planococcus lenghuensis]AQQ53522.1 hypothetical protein B0X71_10855 [Planococcus lenghuensis]